MIDDMLRRCVLHGPGHKLTLSIRIDESERVQAVICLVAQLSVQGAVFANSAKG
jgi:hypothetical protein